MSTKNEIAESQEREVGERTESPTNEGTASTRNETAVPKGSIDIEATMSPEHLVEGRFVYVKPALGASVQSD